LALAEMPRFIVAVDGADRLDLVARSARPFIGVFVVAMRDVSSWL
jgi:hypothetical protein